MDFAATAVCCEIACKNSNNFKKPPFEFHAHQCVERDVTILILESSFLGHSLCHGKLYKFNGRRRCLSLTFLCFV